VVPTSHISLFHSAFFCHRRTTFLSFRSSLFNPLQSINLTNYLNLSTDISISIFLLVSFQPQFYLSVYTIPLPPSLPLFRTLSLPPHILVLFHLLLTNTRTTPDQKCQVPARGSQRLGHRRSYGEAEERNPRKGGGACPHPSASHPTLMFKSPAIPLQSLQRELCVPSSLYE
jgi:hypothetical protein